MALTVLIKQEECGDDLVLTLDAPRLVLGRGKSCEVQLPDPSVSARHASIRLQGGRNLIVDEGSTNGILVGNVRLPPHTPRAISDGELVRIGRVWLELRLVAGVPSSPRQAQTVARDYLRRELTRQGEQVTPLLRVSAGPDEGGCLELLDAGREYLLGRAKDADLLLRDEAASRRHMALECVDGRWCARDLGSKRGSRCAGEALGTEPRPLDAGTQLEAGDNTFVFDDPLPLLLEEMQAAADVRMRSEEYEEPPPGVEVAEPIVEAPPEPHADADVGEDVEDSTHYPGLEPLLEPRGAGYATVDLFVVLVALGLLGLSILGLVYVLG